MPKWESVLKSVRDICLSSIASGHDYRVGFFESATYRNKNNYRKIPIWIDEEKQIINPKFEAARDKDPNVIYCHHIHIPETIICRTAFKRMHLLDRSILDMRFDEDAMIIPQTLLFTRRRIGSISMLEDISRMLFSGLIEIDGTEDDRKALENPNWNSYMNLVDFFVRTSQFEKDVFLSPTYLDKFEVLGTDERRHLSFSGYLSRIKKPKPITHSGNSYWTWEQLFDAFSKIRYQYYLFDRNLLSAIVYYCNHIFDGTFKVAALDGLRSDPRKKITLTEDQLEVMKTLKSSEILLPGPDAYVRIENDTKGKKILSELESMLLVDRPQGPKSGYALTVAGEKHMQSISSL